MTTPLARIQDHHDHQRQTVDQEAMATAEAAETLLGKEGERPMVKRRIATGTGGTVEAPTGMATVEVTVTTARNGADDFRHHNDATNLWTGRCLTRFGNERGNKLRPPSAQDGGGPTAMA